jgi:hypothetical protein
VGKIFLNFFNSCLSGAVFGILEVGFIPIMIGKAVFKVFFWPSVSVQTSVIEILHAACILEV